ncbi:unnamed protein product [Clavelina lepadiformis]|uniref:P-type domain-containing protein n=1 Tax=Clavelina lepadiformis TaxID=159417 RepID=A0ABP0FVB1_CLALP
MKFYFLCLVFVITHWDDISGSNLDCNCWQNIRSRTGCDAGWFLEENVCHLEGCCYDNNTVPYKNYFLPFCYKRKGKCPSDDQCLIPDKLRKVCGSRNMGRSLCESRGCCFDDSQYPYCYYHKRSTEEYQRTIATLSPESGLPTSTNISTTANIASSSVQIIQIQSSNAATDVQITSPASNVPFTKSHSKVHTDGPAGFFRFGDVIFHSRCESDGILCGPDIVDKMTCTSQFCCWVTFNNKSSCIQPTIYIMKWSRNGAWSAWQTWSKCKGETCTLGTQTRRRTCENARKSASNECPGVPEQQRPCIVPCPPTWAPWETWTPCTSTCGPGITRRTRECHQNGSPMPAQTCLGRHIGAMHVRRCNQYLCATWTLWQESPCLNSCGLSYKYRMRACSEKSSKKIDSRCSMSMLKCNLGSCQTVLDRPEVRWAPWEGWSKCSKSCGRGKRFRERSCFEILTGDVVPPKEAKCVGGLAMSAQQEICNSDPCPS